MVVLLFASGKLVCTGVPHQEHVYQVVNRIQQKLREEKCIFYSDLKKLMGGRITQ